MQTVTYLHPQLTEPARNELWSKGVTQIAFPWRGTWLSSLNRKRLKNYSKWAEPNFINFGHGIMASQVVGHTILCATEPNRYHPHYCIDYESSNPLDHRAESDTERCLRVGMAAEVVDAAERAAVGTPITVSLWGSARLNRGNCEAPFWRCSVLARTGTAVDGTAYICTDDHPKWLVLQLEHLSDVADDRPLYIWVRRRFEDTDHMMTADTFREVIATIQSYCPDATIVVYSTRRKKLDISEAEFDGQVLKTVELIQEVTDA